MSKWQEAGFPDRIKTAYPLKIATALLEAINERRAAIRLAPMDIPARLSELDSLSLNNFYSVVDFFLIDQCELWTVPELARDFSGEYPDYSYFTSERLSEAIGEELIEGRKELSPRFFAEWALQRYKILNLFYIQKSGGNLYQATGKQKNKTSYKSFTDALAELQAADWGSSYYLHRGIVSQSQAYNGSLFGQISYWSVLQNCCSWTKTVEAGLQQNIEFWGHAGRPLGPSYNIVEEEGLYDVQEMTFVINNSADTTGITNNIFDPFNTGLQFGQWNFLGKYTLQKGEQRTLNAFDVNAVTPSLPTDPGTPDIINRETTKTIKRGFYLEQVYAIQDYSPGLEYLDLP